MVAMKAVYLIAGTDEGKVSAARSRLRSRAGREGGTASLESFEPQGRRGPDADEFLSALQAISLIPTQRYLLVDGAQGWNKADTERVAGALAEIPPETTIAFFCDGKAPAALAKAVEKAGGDVLIYEAPRERDLPRRLVADAKELDFTLSQDAARMLVERMGPRTVRLRNELQRLAIYVGPGGNIDGDDLAAMIADTSEEAIWTLADAIVEGDERTTLEVAERLVAQGEPLPKVIYGLAPRLRQAVVAARRLEAGVPARQVADDLSMHPYAAKMLVGRIKDRSPEELGRAVIALADLELWSRGGSDYDDGVAMTLALREAVGAGASDAP